MSSSHAGTLVVFMLCSHMVFFSQSIVGLFFCSQSCPMIMSLPSLITIAQICMSRPSIVIVPLAWRVAFWLHVLSSNVTCMFLSIVMMWRLFCRANVSSINVVLAPVSISASPTAHLSHRSFQMAGRVISLPRPGLLPFPGLVRFPILGMQRYSLPCGAAIATNMSGFPTLKAFPAFLLFICCLHHIQFHGVCLVSLCCLLSRCHFVPLSACQVNALSYFLSPEHHTSPV